jgi:hypothetical protein
LAAQIWSEVYARIAEDGNRQDRPASNCLKASHDCPGAFASERIAMIGKQPHDRFGPKGDIRSAAELQASNLQLLALTAYSITSSARTSIEGGTARPRVLAVLARGARPNDLPVQLPAKLYPRA